MVTLADWVTTADLPSSVSSDPGAQVALDGAYATIRTATRQHLLLTQSTVSLEIGYDGWGRPCVTLPWRPIVSIDSVTIVDGPSVATKVEPSRPNTLLLAWYPRRVPLVTSFGTLPLQPSVTVTYTAGYDPTTTAGRESLAAAKSVLLAVANRLLSNPQGLTGEKIDDYSWTAGDRPPVELSAGECAALGAYAPLAGSVRAR